MKTTPKPPNRILLSTGTRIKGRKFPPEILTKEEVLKLIQGCSPNCPTGKRNRALLVILWRGALRIGEALKLKPTDVLPDQVRVLHGKGDKCRTVGIDPSAFAIVTVWIQERAVLNLPKGSPLFCSLKGKRLFPEYVRALMRRLAGKAGIDKRVHPHQLRHTGASELLREGVNLGIISRQLGHGNLATTSRYLDHINPQEVIDRIANREPFKL